MDKVEGRTTELRVALAGAGAMARHHARALQRCRRPVRVVGLADPDPDARAALREIVGDVPGWDSTDELLRASDAEVVHVCAPPRLHAPLALQALAAGCHAYVEKPFAPGVGDAERMLEAARRAGRVVCPGHQLLFEAPSRELERLLPSLGEVVHVESFFSFRPARGGGSGAPLPADEQLLDILPHPVYSALRFLESADPVGRAELSSLELGPGGTVHALLRCGRITGVLAVTLDGRPVQSLLRVVGTNGTVQADYVRGITLRSIGPGSSGIDKVLEPYRHARQLAWGTTRSLARRLLGGGRSYPGLVEIFDAFHEAIEDGAPGPVSERNILGTVRICEAVAEALEASATTRFRPADGDDHPEAAGPLDGGASGEGPLVAVTGGTGFLGGAVVERLLDDGARVRVLARRAPAPWRRDARVEYRCVDLSREDPTEALAGVEAVVHCAAATSGGWDAHEASSLGATERLFLAAARAGVDGIVHVSSLAVLAKNVPGPLDEDTPLEPDARGSGPYVWGKLESERLAERLAAREGLALSVVRPGAIVDSGQFDPPGRLGKRLGNLFVAVGSRKQILGVVELDLAARAIAWMALHREEAPGRLNLLQPELPTKAELVAKLRRRNPDLRVLWLPMWLLRPLSRLAVLAQRVVRPGRPPIDVARVFREPTYDLARARSVARRVAAAVPPGDAVPSGAGGEETVRSAVENPCAV